MNNRLSVLTIVGTRPEIIRLSRVIAKLDDNCCHTLVHTGQNYDYELNEIFFKEMEIRSPDIYLSASGATPGSTIGNIITSVDEILEKNSFDAVLVLGDTNSCLAVIPAKRRGIPIFHMEAGNRCFDQRVPEEINRRIVDHVADVNLPYSNIAREYLIREGIRPDMIIKTGSPMFEVLEHYRDRIESSSILQQLKIQKHRYFVLSTHRQENVDSRGNLKKILEILEAIVERFNYPVILSVHPRTMIRLNAINAALPSGAFLHKPFGFFEYIHLQKYSAAVLSDSGTITEEANILGFNALNLREAHERPEGMEEGAVIMTGLSKRIVLQCLEMILNSSSSFERPHKVSDYHSPNVSDKIVKIIHSYSHYVKRTVWGTTQFTDLS